ncbi:hypothetical protein FB106_10686 [Synechococcus sp. Ace-Pa]|nr:hypothetical protein FB106_10686 [Synechococcus sp. Ace-Pa]
MRASEVAVFGDGSQDCPMTNHILTTPPVAQPALTLFFRSPARALLVLLLFPVIASAQGMLPGCQLVNGSLQCVPGLSTDPEQQIKILRQAISADQAIEGGIDQQMKAVEQVLLSGPALVGAVLTASLPATTSEFHWYRLAPDQQVWQLIEGAEGTTYVVTTADLDQQLMVVSVIQSGETTQRQSSKPLGPIVQP